MKILPSLASKLAGLAICATLAAPALVHAQPFVMAYSGSDVNYLTLTTTAGTVTLNTADNEIIGDKLNQGWWSGTYGNSSFNTNHFTGTFDGGLDWLNSYYIFDLTALRASGGTVLGATLSLNDPNDGGSPPFQLSFYDITTDLGVVDNNNGSSQSIFDDLGSGILYGTTLTNGVPTITANLDSSFIDAINGAQGQYIGVGATLNPSEPQSVPDGASTVTLLGAGLVAVAALRRRMQPVRS